MSVPTTADLTQITAPNEPVEAANSARDLAEALKRAAAAHGEHEKLTGGYDEQWPDWYADYMVRERAGEVRPT